jgi:4-amino-4-deoxy-L-arabinose transferase-like glycosyltransferase
MSAPSFPRWPSEWRWSAGLFIGLLAVYALSAPATVALEDDGEFILAGYFLGIAHPPGYPVHTLLAFVFSQLPIGSVAYRVHLLSGVFGALASCLVYACARRLDVRPALAAGASLCLGLSSAYWSQAIVAEVYTLHVFLFGLALLLSLRIHQGDLRPRNFLGLAAATGLGLANHWPLIVLAGPALLPLVWRQWRALLRLPVICLGSVAAAAPYAWMMLRSQQQPTLSFYGPLESLGELWHFILRTGYAGVDHNPMAGWADRMQFGQFVAGEWVQQFTLAGAALSIAGLHWLWQRRHLAIATALAWSVVAVCSLLVANLDFEYFAQSAAAFRVYPLTAYFATALLLACGLEALTLWVAGRTHVQAAGGLIAAALVAGLAVTSGPVNWRSGDDWGEAYARAIFHETPADAVLIPGSDWAANTLGYLHFVEGYCPECTLLHGQGLLYPSRLFNPVRTPPGEQEQLLADYFSRVRRPRAYTDGPPPGMPVDDRWLVAIVDPDAAGSESSAQVSASAQDFFRHYVARDNLHDATVRTVQQDLRRRYVHLLARAGGVEPANLDALCQEFYGCLGLVEGMLQRPDRYGSGHALGLLARAATTMPAGTHRWDRARVLELQGLLLVRNGQRQEAIAALQAAVTLAPDATAASQRALANLGTPDRPPQP